MLDSLTHGDALVAILLEGGNPEANDPLSEGERTRLQTVGLDESQLHALIVGRVVKGGRGAWALAGERIVMLGQRYRTSVDTLERSDVVRIERDPGRYGVTVRLHTRTGHWAMYAVDPARAQDWAARLQPAA